MLIHLLYYSQTISLLTTIDMLLITMKKNVAGTNLAKKIFRLYLKWHVLYVSTEYVSLCSALNNIDVDYVAFPEIQKQNIIPYYCNNIDCIVLCLPVANFESYHHLKSNKKKTFLIHLSVKYHLNKILI